MNLSGFPTVLVSDLPEPIVGYLKQSFNDAGYNVLLEPDWSNAVLLIRTHSRPIHAFMTNVRRMTSTSELNAFRPNLQVFGVSNETGRNGGNAFAPDSVVAKVKQILEPLKSQQGPAPVLVSRAAACSGGAY
jgi:hypothetical protein